MIAGSQKRVLPTSSTSQDHIANNNEKLGKEFGANDAHSTGGTDSSAAEEQLAIFEDQHEWDPNLTKEKRDEVHRALQTHDIEKEAALDISLIEEQSPYPEVNTSVRNTDEDVPVNTIRVWVRLRKDIVIGQANLLIVCRCWGCSLQRSDPV